MKQIIILCFIIVNLLWLVSHRTAAYGQIIIGWKKSYEVSPNREKVFYELFCVFKGIVHPLHNYLKVGDAKMAALNEVWVWFDKNRKVSLNGVILISYDKVFHIHVEQTIL